MHCGHTRSRCKARQAGQSKEGSAPSGGGSGNIEGVRRRGEVPVAAAQRILLGMKLRIELVGRSDNSSETATVVWRAAGEEGRAARRQDKANSLRSASAALDRSLHCLLVLCKSNKCPSGSSKEHNQPECCRSRDLPRALLGRYRCRVPSQYAHVLCLQAVT